MNNNFNSYNCCIVKKYPCVNIQRYPITVRNTGTLIAVFDVSYFYQGDHFTLASSIIKHGMLDRILIPKNSSSVEIKVYNFSVASHSVICKKFLPFSTSVNITVVGTPTTASCVDCSANNFY